MSDRGALAARIVLNRHFGTLARRAAEAGRSLADFTNALLTCPQHGVMKFREATGLWVCPGFDGEGCPVQWDPEATA